MKAFDLEAALETTRRWPGAAAPHHRRTASGAEAVADAWIPYPAPLLAALADDRRRAGGGRRASGSGPAASAWRSSATTRAAPAAGLAAAARRVLDRGLASRPVLYPDADAMKWSKLLANLVGNATSAILDMDPAAIYADRDGVRGSSAPSCSRRSP